MADDNEANIYISDLLPLEEAAGHEVKETVRRMFAEAKFKFLAPFRTAIVTALPHEFAAMLSMVDRSDWMHLSTPFANVVSYWSLRIPSALQDGVKQEVILCQTPNMGNNSAAVAATSLLKDFRKLDSLIMVGIAGGIPHPKRDDEKENTDYSDHIRLGDIVVSQSGVLQYDMLKVESERKILRADPNRPSRRLLQGCQTLQAYAELGERPWLNYVERGTKMPGYARPAEASDVLYDHDAETVLGHPIQDQRQAGQPLVHFGLVGSANILLKDSRERDRLKDELRIIAVEMEGSGIADATWNFGKGYIVVRGICDYCDMKKKDQWQKYAAVAAAAFARALIEHTPLD